MSKVTEQWSPLNDGRWVLYLDVPLPKYKPYRSYRIDGKIYKPIPMSHTGGKCIAIKGEGNFVGKEVEFVMDTAAAE